MGNVAEKWFADWVVACEHFETIHQHNVVSVPISLHGVRMLIGIITSLKMLLGMWEM